MQRWCEARREFLANYSDGLTDLALPTQLQHFRDQNAVASFVSVKPAVSYHLVTSAPDGHVTNIRPIADSPLRINGGFFILRQDIFDYLGEGEELVEKPFERLVEQQRLVAYQYDGFWRSMDTFKDRTQLESIYAAGGAPWEVWNANAAEEEREPFGVAARTTAAGGGALTATTA